MPSFSTHVTIRAQRFLSTTLIASMVDILLRWLLLAVAIPLKHFLGRGAQFFPKAQATMRKLGLAVIPDHYYWPLINPERLMHPLEQPRALPGIDFNLGAQLDWLRTFSFSDEIRNQNWEEKSTSSRANPQLFRLGNGAFEAGDAEILHHVVRHLKPKRVVEVGSGHSTKIIAKALEINFQEEGSLARHICIEPYEKQWLDQFKFVDVIREKVEVVDVNLFAGLNPGDLLFIDSSHIIRPQGDVLKLYLELLPQLKPGVFVHIHDFFSPRDYPKSWIVDKGLMWNEQYLVEALLTGSESFEVRLSLNYLHEDYLPALRRVCPYLGPSSNPGSLYLQRV
jgi:hypothetical protein